MRREHVVVATSIGIAAAAAHILTHNFWAALGTIATLNAIVMAIWYRDR